MDITEVFIYHELGHYFQYINNFIEPIVGSDAKRYEYFRKSYKGDYSSFEKFSFLEKYAKMTLEVEREAWEIGLKFYKGNEILYHLIEKQSVKTHEDGLNQLLEFEKKRLFEK